MKKIAAVALLALSTGQAWADPIVVQTKSFTQQGGYPSPFPYVIFEPFDSAAGALTDATLRVTSSYTPAVFNEVLFPPTMVTLTTGLCITIPGSLPVCIDTIEPGVYIGSGFAGAPISIDRTFDVTSAVLAAGDDPFVISYVWGTVAKELGGSQFDANRYGGRATLTYYDPPLPVPEPSPLGIMVLALLSVGLIRRKC